MELDSKIMEKAATLIEALPYIQRFNRKIIVVKYGGSAMADEELKRNVIKDVVLLKLVGFKPIIVHGGGKEISRWVSKVGMEPRFLNGLRVTDADTMEIAEMVLNKVNKSLVSMVNELGVKAVGISGKDGQLLRCDKKLSNGQDIGFVGETVNFMNYKGIDNLANAVKDAFGGHLADFAFQCTGSPVAHSNIYKFIRNGGGLCELGFFINGGDATINPHFDLCSKEITLVGSWVYTLRDYATTFDFLKRAIAIGLPIKELITHRFPLEEMNEALETNLAQKGLKIAYVRKDLI